MTRRRSKVPSSRTDRELTFRQELDAFRQQPRNEKVKTIGAMLLFLPFLAVVFLVALFLFGGWAIFEDQLPLWFQRLLTFLLIVLIAWSFLKPVFDRWERSNR